MVYIALTSDLLRKILTAYMTWAVHRRVRCERMIDNEVIKFIKKENFDVNNSF